MIQKSRNLPQSKCASASGVPRTLFRAMYIREGSEVEQMVLRAAEINIFVKRVVPNQQDSYFKLPVLDQCLPQLELFRLGYPFDVRNHVDLI